LLERDASGQSDLSRKDGMTRIGIAYNLKPEPGSAAAVGAIAVSGEEIADSNVGDDEPPSNRATAGRRQTRRSGVMAESEAAVLVQDVSADDEFAEWDTAETIDAVAKALAPLGTIVRLEATPDFPERLRSERLDIVFNMAEGLGGKSREAHVPAICEFFGVPYSGSDPLTLAVCLDKARTKEVLSYYGVATPAFAVVDSPAALNALPARLHYPLFVKPIHEGSSKGITERNLCETPADLASQVLFLLDTYAQPVLVEEFLPGAEYTCAVLGNGPRARVLPIVGINFDALPDGAAPVYGFEAKWVWDRPDAPLNIFDCPAQMPEPLRRAIEATTLRAYQALGCRDWSRIDLRLDANGVPNVFEVNPLPGILPDPADNSCFPKAARAAGIGYDALIQRCLTLAAERNGIRLRKGGGRS
jgi:D-alanine-D-alanine ligase